jgi:dihydrofolate reductase
MVMSKIVVSTFVTLDGVMEAPGGEPGHPHTGWAGDLLDEELIQHKFDEIQETGSLLIGRVTYESFAGAWPLRSGPFADKMNSMPKYVVSTTLRDPAWNRCKVIDADVAARIAALKKQEGGTILVVGSRTLVHALMKYGLVDEFRLMVFPVVLGSGDRLFPESPDKLLLSHVSSVGFASDVMEHTYRSI